MESELTPAAVREGVRSGILAAIQRDLELRGGRTARLLAAAGIVGVAGAVGATFLVSNRLVGQHPPWHLAVASSVWAGLLVVSFAVTFLQLRTPSLPIARAASVGILGLALAGICCAVCPDQHLLRWWSATSVGTAWLHVGGAGLSALCFGLVTTFACAAVAAFVGMRACRNSPVKPLLPAGLLLLLLAPGVLIQSLGISVGAFTGWFTGAAAGAYIGVAGGARARILVSRS